MHTVTLLLARHPRTPLKPTEGLNGPPSILSSSKEMGYWGQIIRSSSKEVGYWGQIILSSLRAGICGALFAMALPAGAQTNAGAPLQVQGLATDASVSSGVSANTDLAGVLAASGTSVTYTFQRSTGYSSHPICGGAAEGTTPYSYAVSYTGTVSVTYTFSASFSGNWDYWCLGRN